MNLAFLTLVFLHLTLNKKIASTFFCLYRYLPNYNTVYVYINAEQCFTNNDNYLNVNLNFLNLYED